MVWRDSAMNVACCSVLFTSCWREAGDGRGTFLVMCRSDTFMVFVCEILIGRGIGGSFYSWFALSVGIFIEHSFDD